MPTAHFSLLADSPLPRHRCVWSESHAPIDLAQPPFAVLIVGVFTADCPPSGTSTADIWILDMTTGVASRVTTTLANEGEPVWSPDGRTLLFASNRLGRVAVFQRSVGSRDDVLFSESSKGSHWPDDWSRDGRFVLINEDNAGIIALSTTGDRKATQVLKSSAVIDEGHFSPDARWIAYVSTESGQAEVYVASFPDVRNVRQVSTGGGNQPLWRHDGKELFYLTGGGRLMAVGVNVVDAALETTAPKMLFATSVRTATPGVNSYAVSADGSRFLVFDSPNDDRQLSVVLNWPNLLK